ncbi:hypothetical protein OLMES_5500 [Oleiphilus messinensis]|uniref:Uncharacterized protein n=1 Tax=Oleiphilus messinensis TaxID=141451 RepID=A0A1Y0IGQ1_9GAMM|nr:hypothetical protein [Oleiphilus messinensis]ARU59480.1 hypothetical protein OLMES_5500 [Oleiphilus messinensis]
MIELIKRIFSITIEYVAFTKNASSEFLEKSNEVAGGNLLELEWYDINNVPEAMKRLQKVNVLANQLMQEFEAANIIMFNKFLITVSGEHPFVVKIVAKKASERVVEEVNKTNLIFGVYQKIIHESNSFFDFLLSLSGHYAVTENEILFEDDDDIREYTERLNKIEEFRQQLFALERYNRKLVEQNLRALEIEIFNHSGSEA